MDFLGVEGQYEVFEFGDGSKGWIPIVSKELKPKINDKFSTYSDAESMYRRYANVHGFDVRLNAKMINNDGVIQAGLFAAKRVILGINHLILYRLGHVRGVIGIPM